MKNQNNVNDLINSLVNSFKEFDNSFKNKIKVNSIFSNLDENTNKNFIKLVNLSSLRYKSVKSGGRLNNIITVQKPKYENLIEELKNDKLYSTNIIEKEKAKLFKNSFRFKNKEINDIRNKLKTSLKLKQNIYEYKNKEKISPKEKILKLKGKIKKMVNLAYVDKFFDDKIQKKRLENKTEKLIDSLIDNDYKYFHDRMKIYNNFLNKIRNLSENNKNKKNMKFDKTIFKETIQSMNPNSFRALTYTEHSLKKDKNINKKDFEFDLRKIKNIKLSHDKNYNNILKRKYLKKNEIKINSSLAANNSLRIKAITSNNLTNSNFSKTVNNYKTADNISQRKNKSLEANKLDNFKNTAYIVLNETENGLFNEENFTRKRDKLNNHYKIFKAMNKTNNKYIKNLTENNIPKLKDIDNSYKNNKRESIIEITDYTGKNVDSIKKKFQEIYEQKKKKWKKEDKLREIKKERDIQNMYETEKFLFEIQDKSLSRKNKTKYNKY